nr:flagellar hook-basal body complex protein FliE [uncultured Cellulosilyticum sp.]
MISQVQQLSSLFTQQSAAAKKVNLSGDASFTQSLEAAKNLIDANLQAEQETNELTMDFLTGANDNIHSLLISQSKASILLQYTMQVRNGVLDAYKEIMQLSV